MTRKHLLILTVIFAGTLTGLLTTSCLRSTPPTSPNAPAGIASPDPNVPKTYPEAVARLRTERVTLSERYRQTTDPVASRRILQQASRTLANRIYGHLMPFWYGTKWDFNGTTETPGTGKIACGYFVTTVLRDAGLRVQRVRLAQQASENIIRTLTSESHIQRFSRVSLPRFVAAVKARGVGIYVVGLDYHAGFLVHDGREVWFIHSAGVAPYCVVKERATTSKVLSASRYRVIGHVTADETLVTKWLAQTPLPTRTR